jgi:hypothetical protein
MRRLMRGFVKANHHMREISARHQQLTLNFAHNALRDALEGTNGNW